MFKWISKQTSTVVIGSSSEPLSGSKLIPSSRSFASMAEKLSAEVTIL